jgi:hypothetical protein
MHWTRTNWQKLFNYGEVICFASAWAVALLMALSAQRPADDRAATRSFVLSSDVSGMQATLSRRSRQLCASACGAPHDIQLVQGTARSQDVAARWSQAVPP